jgi:hypothetical protein
MFLLIPLVCLIVIPGVRVGSRPSPRLQQLLAVPWQGALVLAVVNLLVLTITAALFFGLSVLAVPQAPLLPMIVGPALSFAAWTHMGRAMPLNGTRRWCSVLAGMSPYLLLTVAAWLWTRSIPEGGPGDDTFMAWIGGLMLMVVGIGATSLGTLVTGLVRDRSL